MNEMRFKLSGLHVVVAVAVVVLIVVVKVATLGETDDPALHEAIKVELQSELGGRIGQEMKTLDTKDEAATAAFLDRVDPDAIQIHSASVSKPLLSVGTSVEAVASGKGNSPCMSFTK